MNLAKNQMLNSLIYNTLKILELNIGLGDKNRQFLPNLYRMSEEFCLILHTN